MTKQPNDITTFDFDTIHPRKEFSSTKWLEMGPNFGSDDLIPLWVADMDFQVAPVIQQAILEMANHGIYGYMYRSEAYFEAISNWYQKRHQWTVDPSTMVFSPGVIFSLSIFIEGLTAPGDGILIQEPVYYPFKQKILEFGRIPIINPLQQTASGNYVMDFIDFEEQLKNHRPKVFILCNPHNPIGRVWTTEELTTIGDLCLKYDVKVISDEIHCDLVFKPHRHVPFASISPEFAQNSVTLCAPSKTFNLAGLQTSFALCTNPNDFNLLTKALQRSDIKRNNSFSLVATQAAYQEGAPWLEALLSYIKDNEHVVRDFFKMHFPSVHIADLEGTYLLWLDFRSLGFDEETLHHYLIDQAQVALSKGSNFGQGGEGFVRMNLGCPRGILEEALNRLLRLKIKT